MARNDLDDVAACHILACPGHGVLVGVTGEGASDVRRDVVDTPARDSQRRASGGEGSRRPEALAYGLDAVQGVSVGLVDVTAMRRQVGVGEDAHAVLDVVEDDQRVGEHHDRIRELQVITRWDRQFLEIAGAFVREIANDTTHKPWHVR